MTVHIGHKTLPFCDWSRWSQLDIDTTPHPYEHKSMIVVYRYSYDINTFCDRSRRSQWSQDPFCSTQTFCDRPRRSQTLYNHTVRETFLPNLHWNIFCIQHWNIFFIQHWNSKVLSDLRAYMQIGHNCVNFRWGHGLAAYKPSRFWLHGILGQILQEERS